RRSSRVGARLAELLAVIVLVLDRWVVALPRPQRPQRRLALLAFGAVEDQDPVEVVDLVLEDARLESRGLDRDGVAVDVATGEASVQGALDVHRHPRKDEAALLGNRQLLGH